MGWNYKYLFIMAVVGSVSAAPSYTTVCNQEVECETGFYCETDFTCKPCLRCQDLKRELPPTSVDCVTSIFECGPCIDGLKEDRATAKCITSTEQSIPTWTIIVIVAGSLLLFTIICGIAAYMLLNLLYLKIFASTTIRAPCENQIEEVSAPPPPYNTIALLPKAHSVEESIPFMETVKDKFNSEKHDTLERRAAHAFIDPAYLRNPQKGSTNLIPANGTTLESPLEDQEDSVYNDLNSTIDFSQELRRVRDATEQHSLVPHIVRVGQDSNNRSQAEENQDSTHSFFNRLISTS